MATSKEFNRLFDLAEKETNNLIEAQQIAYTCGWRLHYMDGQNVETDYKEQCWKRIASLIGPESTWPKSIIESFKEGCNDGWLET